MNTECRIIDKKTVTPEDDQAQVLIAEAIRIAVNKCYEVGILDPEHDIVSCRIEVRSNVSGQLS